MKDFLYSIVIAFSFFTIIPLPAVEWTDRRLKFLPLFMPLVGLGIGSVGYGLYHLLISTDFSEFINAVSMVIFFLAITGGIHMDGLMDTADAYFSRRGKKEKLEIMKDSRVGAFAVMSLVSLVLIKTAFFYELFLKGKETAILLVFIPVLSRIVQALMLCLFPYAKEDGLAALFRQASGQRTTTILVLYFMLATGLIYLLLGLKGLILPLGLLLFTIFYYFSTKRNFGGITGDIVGAFLELAEVLMLGILMAM